jgi:hypothetical protein
LDNISDLVNQGTSIARRMYASLYNWIVYKQGSKAREKERRRVVAPLEVIYNPLVT